MSRGFAGARVAEDGGQGSAQVVFEDVTRAAGIEFHHTSGAFGRKYLPETMGSGVAFLDYDGDEWPDLLFVNSRHWPGHEGAEAATPALYRNLGTGCFEEVTGAAGLDFAFYGMGVAAADYDADGDLDLFFTAAGENRLLAGEGGRFRDVTASAGVGGGTWRDERGGEHPEWSSGAAFFDADGDGDLDLFVANYVKWSIESDVFTTMNGRTKAYTTPSVYPGLRPRLYANRGDGTFDDISARIELAADADPKSLGVIVIDFDRDGRPDVFVTNDTQPNYLLHNLGDGRFRDVALEAGVAYDETGHARAGMGVGATAMESGEVALAVGNFSREALAFFTRFPSGVFIDRAAPLGLGAATQPALTFGLCFLDYDLDGRDDLALANGHIEPSIEEVQREVRYAQPPQLFRRGAQRFREVSSALGADFSQPMVARGLAVADYDRDGDPDLVFSTNGGAARLLRNGNASGRSWLRVRLAMEGGNRAAIGAEISVRGGGIERRAVVRAGGSYLSQDEFTRTFGLDQLERVERLTVRWPDGVEESFVDLEARREILIERGRGVRVLAR